MSRSFAILLREARESTPDPLFEGKRRKSCLTQHRLAEILEVHVQTIRNYEWGTRLPHPTIRRELFRLFPSLSKTE